MTFGSLFSGIGGIDLGLERAGMTCKWQVEMDDFCQEILTKHWPDVPKHKDIKEVRNLPYVDLIAGGFPCQDVSVAGKQAGIQKETRSGLWFEFARIIRMVRPEYILVENVSGLLNNGMGVVLGELAQIGYDAEWQSIQACWFGAPHRRERIFIIAYSNSQRIKGVRQEKVCRQPFFSWCEGIRRVEGFRNRSDIPFPLIRRINDGVRNRVDNLGNAVVPQVAEYIGKAIINSNQCIQGTHDKTVRP